MEFMAGTGKRLLVSTPYILLDSYADRDERFVVPGNDLILDLDEKTSGYAPAVLAPFDGSELQIWKLDKVPQS